MIQRSKHAAANGEYCWFATQGDYLGRAAVAPSQSMSLWHGRPIGPGRKPHISPLAHGGRTRNTSSNNHPGSRYRRYRKWMVNLTVPPTPPLEKQRNRTQCRILPSGFLVFTWLFNSVHKGRTYHHNEHSIEMPPEVD